MTPGGSYRLGYRAIKTAIVVFLCFLFSYLFHRENAFYAAVAAVVCLQQTYGKTYLAGLHRLIGTGVGGLSGFLLLELSGVIPDYAALWHVFLIPLFLLLPIYACNLIGRRDAVAISCIVFLSIAVNIDHTIRDAFPYVVNRMVDTGIGIVLAMLVNRFLFPYQTEDASTASASTEHPRPKKE